MENFFKYVTPGEEDRNWGLYLNAVGRSIAPENTTYPNPEHPTGYFFNWKKGRILNEYQLNYITNGEGIFENKDGKLKIHPGSLIITRPGVWHRYKPLLKKGWTENYIGFQGFYANYLFEKNRVLQNKTVIRFGVRSEFIDTYYKIFDLIKEEKPGFQQITSGLIIKLLGYIISNEKQKNFNNNPIEGCIQKARFLMQEKIEQKLSMQEVAAECNIGYSYFRKMFKQYTGNSPQQYHIELKILKAKELLLTSEASIKEIGYHLGFESANYFHRIFKNKTGLSPMEFRLRTISC